MISTTNTSDKCSIGVDIGGTNMRAILFKNNKILFDYNLATPQNDKESFLIMLKALIEPLLERANQENLEIKGIGVGIAGIYNFNQDKIIFSPNIKIIEGLNLKEEIKKLFNLDKIIIDNDANCFLLAESRLGAVKNYSNVFGVTIGTGIGGSWLLNKKIYQGMNTTAIELGHIIVDYNDLITIEESFQKLTKNNPKLLAEKAKYGDKLAESLFKELGKILGIELANIINLLDPQIIVIGGGVVESSNLFIDEVEKYKSQFTISPLAKKAKIIKASLKNSGAIGAALLVD